MIHIGKEIEKVINNRAITVTDFAIKINKSRTVAYDIFKRSSIDTELLSTICQVLNYDFFRLYKDSENLEKKSSDKNPNDEWKTKYFLLLEKHNLLLENKLRNFSNSKSK